jgi:hypothetical protein
MGGWWLVGWWKRTSMRVVLVVAKEIEKFEGGREVGKLDDNHSVLRGCNFLVLWLDKRKVRLARFAF